MEANNSRLPGRRRILASVRTFVREAPEVLDIRVNNETITATPEHPFWVVEDWYTISVC